ncbi:MAG TPA: hypothetical protein ENF73_05125 [Proteobacteria bacterium]|nr:hypothetical protein [Pseudomonadota bacterium]
MAVLRGVGVLIVLLAVSTGAWAGWSLQLDQKFPVCGEPARLTITPPAGSTCDQAKVFVTYRPNSKTETTEAVGTPDESCSLVWIPQDPGISRLTLKVGDSKAAERLVSVRFAKSSALGILILIVAGCILYGGIAYSFKISFSQEDWK